MTQVKDPITDLVRKVECDSCGDVMHAVQSTVHIQEVVHGPRSSIVFVYDQCLDCWLDGKPLSKKGRLKKRAEIMARKKGALP